MVLVGDKSTRANLLRQQNINIIPRDGPIKAPDLRDVPLAIDLIQNERDRKTATLAQAQQQTRLLAPRPLDRTCARARVDASATGRSDETWLENRPYRVG